jgi:hypothetical protein
MRSELDEPIEESRAHAQALLALLRREIPRTAATPWEAYAAMLLARSAGALLSVARLDPGTRTLDASVLLRVLLDHVTHFAWVAIDPDEHIRRWRASDAGRDVREHRAWEPYGLELLDSDALARTQRLANSAKRPPDLAQRAAEADDFWRSRVPGFAPEHHPSSVSSFRALYRTVFTIGSAATHPSITQANYFMKDAPGGTLCHWERTPAGSAGNWWAVGPYILGLGLLVASEALGWPDAREVARAIGREEAIDGGRNAT